MVVDFQSAPRTDFGVVLLESLGPGQTITVTNDGWGPDQVTGAFNLCSKHITTYADGRQTLSGNQEASFMTYTPSTDVPAGTVLRPSDFNGTLSFNVGSDQLLVYHGSITAPPRFLCAFDNSVDDPNPTAATINPTTNGWCQRPSAGWHISLCNDVRNCASCLPYFCNSPFYSALPAGLTSGADALAFRHQDSWAYAGDTLGSPIQLRERIADVANWVWQIKSCSNIAMPAALPLVMSMSK